MCRSTANGGRRCPGSRSGRATTSTANATTNDAVPTDAPETREARAARLVAEWQAETGGETREARAARLVAEWEAETGGLSGNNDHHDQSDDGSPRVVHQVVTDGQTLGTLIGINTGRIIRGTAGAGGSGRGGSSGANAADSGDSGDSGRNRGSRREFSGNTGGGSYHIVQNIGENNQIGFVAGVVESDVTINTFRERD
ncbi:hypothetical protein [Kineosporia babensis]|uniref:Uncharacterized protein n=1 Tax=Kineosporia babensis TaxID=499548 RepID=A0A9X1NLE1_9ACTN|nr:hypothetical protein [Kineosporia babensis]MCD5317167.1 hypothetical protein [Kineosporia babensis]